jgi:hypothetical protein
MLKRFLYAVECFFYAWRNYHPKREIPVTFENWLAQITPFAIGDYDYIKGRESTIDRVFPPGIESHMLPKGLDPYMLKKRCVNKEGDVRYFEVVPHGWTAV